MAGRADSARSPDLGSGDRMAPNKPPNVVRVLDGVQCHESYNVCNQEKINEIWSACLQEGFSESTTDKTVNASYSIKELAIKTLSETRSRPKIIDKVSEEGVVTEVEEGVEGYSHSREIKGYCIGSEYILQVTHN